MLTKTIPMILMNDFRRQWADTREASISAFSEIGESGWYILGAEVAAFESALGEIWSMPQAIGVASGLDAIEISLKALGCGRGDRVLTTPMSAFATTLAIVKSSQRGLEYVSRIVETPVPAGKAVSVNPK